MMQPQPGYAPAPQMYAQPQQPMYAPPPPPQGAVLEHQAFAALAFLSQAPGAQAGARARGWGRGSGNGPMWCPDNAQSCTAFWGGRPAPRRAGAAAAPGRADAR
jgi:hypothetical protein